MKSIWCVTVSLDNSIVEITFPSIEIKSNCTSENNSFVNSTVRSVITGLGLIHRNFLNLLHNIEIEPFYDIDESFNNSRHEVFEDCRLSHHDKAVVKSALHCGYKQNNRILRKALVVITSKK